MRWVPAKQPRVGRSPRPRRPAGRRWGVWIGAAALILALTVSVLAVESGLSRAWVVTVDGEILGTAREEDALSETVETVLRARQSQAGEGELLQTVEIRQVEGAVPPEISRDLAEITALLYQSVTVRTVTVDQQQETIPFQTVTTEDAGRYSDETEVTQEGQEGLRQITTTTVWENGRAVSVSREETVLAEAVDALVTVGTAERPDYLLPVDGAVTSAFSPSRTLNGVTRPHNGVDLAAAEGTEVCAARAGTVSFAGWNDGGYGNLVILDHGDGAQTYYAHNSELLVSAGDTVSQDQVIALAGNTGRSFGAHCHFELRLDGTPVDPMDYAQ